MKLASSLNIKLPFPIKKKSSKADYNFMHKNNCPTYFSSQVNVFHNLLFLILSSDVNK